MRYDSKFVRKMKKIHAKAIILDNADEIMFEAIKFFYKDIETKKLK